MEPTTPPSDYLPFTQTTTPSHDIHLIPKTTTTSTAHSFTLIWMHGLGDTAEGFLEFFQCKKPWLPEEAKGRTKVVLLNAPKQPVSSMGGVGMNSWYDMIPTGKGDETTDDEV